MDENHASSGVRAERHNVDVFVCVLCPGGPEILLLTRIAGCSTLCGDLCGPGTRGGGPGYGGGGLQ